MNLNLVSSSPVKRIQMTKKSKRLTSQTRKGSSINLKKEKLNDGMDWMKHIHENNLRSSQIESESLVCEERDDNEKLAAEESVERESSDDQIVDAEGNETRDCFISIDSGSISRGDILEGYKSTMVGSVSDEASKDGADHGKSDEASKDGADHGKSGTVVNMEDETSEQQEHEVKGQVLTGRRGGKPVKMASCSLCLLVLRKDGLARHLAMHRRKELNTDREEMSNVGKKRN